MDVNASRVNIETLSISILIQFRKNILPDAILPPLGKTGINALPRTVVLWELSPLHSAVIYPKHTVQHRSVVFSGASFLPAYFVGSSG